MPVCEYCGTEVPTSLAMHWAKRGCKPVVPPAAKRAKGVEGSSSSGKDVELLHLNTMLRQSASELLQHLRYDKLASEALIDELKPALARLRQQELMALRLLLLPLVPPAMHKNLETVLNLFADPVYGLRTAKHEMDFMLLEKHLIIPTPRIRNLRSRTPGASIDYKDVKNHGSVGISIIDSISRLMIEDASICEQIIKHSDELKTGAFHGVPSEYYADITDGANFRNHAISRKAEDDEKDVVRIGLLLYAAAREPLIAAPSLDCSALVSSLMTGTTTA